MRVERRERGRTRGRRRQREKKEGKEERDEEKVIILLDTGLIHFAVDIIVIVRRQVRWISARSQQEVRDLLRSNLTVLRRANAVYT